MTDHLKEARNNSNSKVYRAIRKYSITRDNFEIIEQNIETQEQVNEREIYWIAYYNSFKDGYNSTLGGDIGNGGMLKGENSPKAAFTNEEVKKIRLIRATLKYTKTGKISIYAENRNTLVIKDTGIGIAAEDLPRIIQKGYTGYNGREDKKSTGLGLFLCGKIIGNLGHEIKISSEVGEGTVVRIIFTNQTVRYE